MLTWGTLLWTWGTLLGTWGTLWKTWGTLPKTFGTLLETWSTFYVQRIYSYVYLLTLRYTEYIQTFIQSLAKYSIKFRYSFGTVKNYSVTKNIKITKKFGKSGNITV